MTIETLKNSIQMIAGEYPIKKVILFGSRAEGVAHEGRCCQDECYITKVDE